MKRAATFLLLGLWVYTAAPQDLERLRYNHPSLIVDLGVGLWAWPLPMDYDGDGDLDLVVSCPDVPYNGIYLFENPGADPKMPVFKPPVKVGPGERNITASYPENRPRVLVPGEEITGFSKGDFKQRRTIYPKSNVHSGDGRVRANQWSYVDYDGDGALDLIVGVGDWDDYGWDDAFNSQGRWTRGPLHGYVYLIRNRGTTRQPDYAVPVRLAAGGRDVDVYGMPSPNFADFDSDGDLDLLCGDFLDGFTYFQNVGTRSEPRYASGRELVRDGKPVEMHLCMITPVAIDWDRDGDMDLIVGQEDGRVAFLEHTGKVAYGMPVFRDPRFFQQEADEVKFGALVTPVSSDWDGDGDEDLVCGNTAGEIGFIENLDGSNPPRWAAPRLLEADGRVVRIMAGPNGSIQGPAEAKWGYTTLCVADWDHDGLPDIVANSIWGKVHWYRNIGTRTAPKLAAAAPIEVEWAGRPPKPAWNWWNPTGKELATQWRTTPAVFDFDRDGLNDLVMLDHEGYLALFRRDRRDGKVVLLPGERQFLGGTYDRDGMRVGEASGLLRLNDGTAGRSGRRKFCIADWDGDGQPDLLVNAANADLLRNAGHTKDGVLFEHAGALARRRLAGHTTSPTTVDWDRDGVRDLLLGAEDGFFYFLANPRKSAAR